MTLPPPLPVTGRVEAVNDRGIKLDGAWHNLSKWAEDVVMPERGEMVTLIIDRQGFVRSVQNGANGSPAVSSASVAPNASSARETTITRVAVLKAAARFCASKPESKSTDVLTIADAWLRWVDRSELEDAF